MKEDGACVERDTSKTKEVKTTRVMTSSSFGIGCFVIDDAPAPPGVAAPAAPLGHPADPSGFIVYAAAMQQQNPAILQDPNGTAMLYSGWANLPAAERDRYRAALAARRAQAPRAA